MSRLVHWATSGLALLVLLLPAALCVGCGKSRPAPDGLTVEEAEVELQSLPVPASKFFDAISAKHNFTPDPVNSFRKDVSHDKWQVDRIVELAHANQGPMTKTVWPTNEQRITGVVWMQTWDYRIGEHGLSASARWQLFLDSDNNIIGYNIDYVDPPPKSEVPAANQNGNNSN